MKIALAGAGIYNYDNIKNFLTGGGAKPAATTSPTSPTSRALSPDVTVVPRDKDAVIPPPAGGEGQTLGSNKITPEQVKENLKNYPNSSGRPWSTLSASGQVLDASGRTQTYTGSYQNEYDGAGNVVGQRDMGMGPDGIPIAVSQAQYMNERGRRTAFQHDLDVNSQLRDSGSPLYMAWSGMASREQARQAQIQARNSVGGTPQMTQESKDLYAGMIKGMSLEEKKRQFASGKLFPDEE